jgi:adenosylcobyric acid synthase
MTRVFASRAASGGVDGAQRRRGVRVKGVLVAGTSSDAGKSVITAGICRWLYRRGVSVAPFKAQNMSNNSAIAVDGGELGRAQALQAAACHLEPSVRFNPVLLKPGSDRTSQVVVLGKAVGQVGARNYGEIKERLRGTVLETLRGLGEQYEVVVCEGAGSPAEINLRAHDIVNMGLAQAAELPVIVVGDIDRGGVFAAFYGTLALLEPADQALVAGFVINKFRGDAGILEPGLDTLERLTGRPMLGVLPWQPDLWIDGEDSLAYQASTIGRPTAPVGRQWLRVAVVRLPRISNATDAEALATADLVVLPGSKSTVDDLGWLRATGLAEAIREHATAGKPVLGICGGFQMLAERIVDPVESGLGEVAGLGLLPVEVTFEAEKVLGRPGGVAYGDVPVHGYEIHHGRVTRSSGAPWFRLPDGGEEGIVAGNIFATHWHGALESDEFRRRFLTDVARLAGRAGFKVAPRTSYAALRERTLDVLADLVEAHLDTEALWRLIEHGAPPGLKTISV